MKGRIWFRAVGRSSASAAGTIGAISTSDRLRPAFSIPRNRGAVSSSACAALNRNGSQPSARAAGLLDRPGSGDAEEERYAAVGRQRQQLERHALSQPLAVGGDGPLRALVIDRLPAQGPADHLDVLTGPGQRFAERHAVPALGDLRAGQAQTEHDPPAGEVVQGHRGCRHRGGLPGRDLKDGGAEPDAVGDRRKVAQQGDRLLAPGFGDPHGVEPQFVGEPGDFDLLPESEPGPVGDSDANTHGCSFGVDVPSAGLANSTTDPPPNQSPN